MRATTTVTVTSTATQIFDDNPSRRGLVMRNTDASVSIFYGSSNAVTASSTNKGTELKAGEPLADTITRGQIWAITASGSVAVSRYEVV